MKPTLDAGFASAELLRIVHVCSSSSDSGMTSLSMLVSLQAHGPFSAVVIATPLEFSNIRFSGLELPHIPPRKFQSTISTFVRGVLNGTYFGVKQPPKGRFNCRPEQTCTVSKGLLHSNFWWWTLS